MVIGTKEEKMSSNSVNFTKVVDDAIARRGYRISSRMPLEYRLGRYIQLYAAESGEERPTREEIDVAVGILMLGHDCASIQNDMNVPSGQVTFQVNRDNSHTRSFTERSGHAMVRRSQVNTDWWKTTRNSRPNITEGGFTRPGRTHPMRLRSCN
jgi:hypothetical protein